MIFHIAFYLHLGPFAQFVIRRLEHEMDEFYRHPPARHAAQHQPAAARGGRGVLSFPEPFRGPYRRRCRRRASSTCQCLGTVTVTHWLGTVMDKLSYRCHRFPSIVIQQAVWLYFRFALS